MSIRKFDQELLNAVVLKCLKIRDDMRWASAEALDPHIDSLSNLLKEAFEIKDKEVLDDSLMSLSLLLEKKRIFSSDTTELIELLMGELEDSYGDDDFESEYISDTCDSIINTCKKYIR